jgi:hypothetical protein
MVKHILLFRLKPEAEGATKAENILKAKKMLEDLNGKIPGLIKIEVGTDFSGSDTSADMCLYSEFESREALAVYAKHPDHLAVIPFIKAIYEERRLIDYDI